MDCAFRVILMGARVTEQRHNAVANVIRYDPVKATDRVCTAVIINARNLVQVFWIKGFGETR
jgi:hypothetical protein